MASDENQTKVNKSDGFSKTISWLRKVYSNFTANVRNDKNDKRTSRARKKKFQPDLLTDEPDIMLRDKDKIRTSVRIYRNHPPDFPTTEQIKARLMAADKYYGVPKTMHRPAGENMVFEEDAEDVVQIRPSWAYILERPLVEQYVLMSNYIRRLSAMSEAEIPDDYKYVEELRHSDDDLDEGLSCVTGRSTMSYLGSMYIKPATAPSEKEDTASDKEETKLSESSVEETVNQPIEGSLGPKRSSVDYFYPSLDDDPPQSSYEKQEFEMTYTPRSSLVDPEKDLSQESSDRKLSISRDSFLEFRNMRVQDFPEQKINFVVERTTEIKPSRMTVNEKLTVKQNEDDFRELAEKTHRHTVRFACPPPAGGGVSRIARIFEKGGASSVASFEEGSHGLSRAPGQQEPGPVQIHVGNLLSKRNVSDNEVRIDIANKDSEFERIPLPSFSGSGSGNDSPNEDNLSN